MALPTSLSKRGEKEEKKKPRKIIADTHHCYSFAWGASIKNSHDLIQAMLMITTFVVFLTAWKESVTCENRLPVLLLSVEVIFFFMYMIYLCLDLFSSCLLLFSKTTTKSISFKVT